MTRTFSRSVLASLLASGAGLAHAQWDPANGQWGKEDSRDLRVMTWNVEDAICRTNQKLTNRLDWDALVRITAAMKPDVLILQEAGDNSGNNTGSGVDSPSQLETVIDLFFNGGNDPFNGGVVTSYVQLYAPGYTLPHVFASSRTDNFNRNVIISRYPFSDLNGDGNSTYSDILFLRQTDTWNIRGTGGIRGYQFAEIDLPDNEYGGDVVVGNGHLKAGGSSGDFDQREDAARNVSYFIHYWYNGAGTGIPDPNDIVSDSPVATTILDPVTPVIWGGDWNEDETSNGNNYGPADWMTQGAQAGGTDGTDRDGTDSTRDSATDQFNGSIDTRGSSKLDYLAWTDSAVAGVRRQFVYNSATGGSNAIPLELQGYIGNPFLATNRAADHQPVIVDFILAPAISAPEPFNLLAPADASSLLTTAPTLSWELSNNANDYDVVIATDAILTDTVSTQTTAASSIAAPDLGPCGTFYWQVTAQGAGGTLDAANGPWSFNTRALADVSTDNTNPGDAEYGVPDGVVTTGDLTYFVEQWIAQNPVSDVTTSNTNPGDAGYAVPDGTVDTSDLTLFVEFWLAGGCA
ncbi:MAG: GC-type dockerin domain-anchored protein [Planctomycetota bacterium]